MTTMHRGLSRIALSLSLAALATTPVLAAPAAAPAAPAPDPAAEILPVPLTPAIPAAQRVCNATTASDRKSTRLNSSHT